MGLIRDWTTVTDTGLSVATIVSTSDLRFPVDNINLSTSINESVQFTESEFVTLLGEMGVSSPNASTTVAGIVEIATDAEVDSGTDTGGTGATLAVTPSQINNRTPEKTYEFNSNIVTALEKGWYGEIEILALNFDVAEIDSFVIETRLGAGTTYTIRADLSALNTYLAGLSATDHPYIRFSATFDAAYTGKADLKTPYKHI